MSLFKTVSRTFATISTEDIIGILRMSENSFNRVLNKVKIIKCENGKCLAEMKVDEEHVNSMNSLHGGLSATIVDSMTSIALFTDEKHFMIPSVSVDFHMSFLKAAAIGDEIVIHAETEKAGKSLAYLKCEIRNKATGDVLVKGSQTKHFIRSK